MTYRAKCARRRELTEGGSGRKWGCIRVTRNQMTTVTERFCREVVNCSLAEALLRLSNGEWHGTMLECQLRSFLFLTGRG